MAKKHLQQVSDYALMLLLVALPISIRLTNILLIAFAILWFVAGRETIISDWKKNHKKLIINILPFLFLLLSLTWANSGRQGWSSIEKYIPLLAFPLLISAMRPAHSPNTFAKVFAYTILAMGIVCVTYGTYNVWFSTEDYFVGDAYNKVESKWNMLTNEVLMRPFEISPIYMSLYVSFSLYVFLFDRTLKTWLKALILLFLLAFLLLAASRIGIGAFVLAGVFIIIFILKKEYRTRALIALGAGAVVVAGLLFFNPILYKRYVADVGAIALPADVTGWNGINLRHAIWKCSFEKFLEHPLIGYGTAGHSALREECYTQYTFYGPFGTDLNSHNQYFEYALIGGVVLILLFGFQLGYSLVTALRRKENLYLAFVVIMIAICLGESVLETHKGIVFFSIFNCLFLFNTKQNDISQHNER